MNVHEMPAAVWSSAVNLAQAIKTAGDCKTHLAAIAAAIEGDVHEMFAPLKTIPDLIAAGKLTETVATLEKVCVAIESARPKEFNSERRQATFAQPMLARVPDPDHAA